MPDQLVMKLGKKAAKFDPHTLRLETYLTPALPEPAPLKNWTVGLTSFGMMLNDKLGDCTIAACGHALQIWSKNVDTEITVPDSQIEKYYQWWDGYVPGDPDSDQGGVEIDVLNSWRKNGFAGHKLIAYADPSVTNHTHIKQAITLFGGVYIGLQLPLSVQNKSIWDAKGDTTNPDSNSYPGSWGGHAVFVPAYNHTGPVCITWGVLQQMTWKFWDTYVDEVHALLAGYWLENRTAPSGFNLKQLEEDLKAVTK